MFAFSRMYLKKKAEKNGFKIENKFLTSSE